MLQLMPITSDPLTAIASGRSLKSIRDAVAGFDKDLMSSSGDTGFHSRKLAGLKTVTQIGQ
jgi:hypothetical protein